MIGIIGGYGAVGAETARLLSLWDIGPLRLGGRDPERARRFAAAHLPGAEATAVDVDDDASLAAFVRGCELVVHCAGPSYRTAERVAYAALIAGAHHVDAGGGERLDALGMAAGTRSLLFAAGAVPGLSGLLPRWLAAQDFDAVHGLTAYTGVLDRFTATGAEDYLHGVLGGANEPLAAWQDGGRRSGALTRRAAVELPFFPRPVAAFPYLDAEGDRLARELSLVHGRWYTVLDGEHLGAALDAARALDRGEAVAGLCRATALDAAGRTPYVTFLVQADGTAAGRPLSRTAVLRAPGIARLTGAVTAVAALAVLRGEAPSGAHAAATALDPQATLARLRETPGLCDVTVFDGPLDALVTVEEGVL
ncbi:saccharopine dehydrogenase NADP-binding domain-containing protein [Streptomyces sp. XD-27]|uniref:saccharopine dehydrogenase NADP-binding domain-containing protein n=1 Tax=Streptomyces sp. XD-27 TaxID=3062779 RepID=UPI0026F42298|nr:saccharopine dehydrogenase NADP-binding domain-containing protein [Streptomyces sp. XD-27]WKX69036.1 saccharopine dehydrogenase NADP-binding domain-containing protein [Streptomyces sp. XD-27]